MVDRDVVRRGYDGLAETYAAERDPDSREGAVLEDVLEQLSRPTRVLDVGCGQGEPALRRSSRATDVDVTGIDFSRGQLEYARSNAPDASLVQGDMTSLPIGDAAVDAVTAFHSLIHVPIESHRTVIDEFARVLRPNGLLVLTEGTNDWRGANPDWLESGVEMQWHIAGADRTRAQLRRAGFAIRDQRLIPDELADEESLWTFFVARLED